MNNISEMISRDRYCSKAFAIYCTMNSVQKQKFDDYFETLTRSSRHLPAVAIAIKTDKPYLDTKDLKDLEANYKEKSIEYLTNVPITANDAELKNAIKLLFEYYGLNNSGYGSPFLSCNPKDEYSFPIQGWKFHVASENIRDYYNMVKTVISDCINHNIIFKVVNPFLINYENTNNLYGKDITIYPNKEFSFSHLSNESKRLLSEPCNKIADSDIAIDGKISGRFGSFLYPYIITSEGTLEHDNRESKEELSDMSNKILDYQPYIYKKYEQDHNQRRYIQEYVLGMELQAGDTYLFDDFVFDKTLDTDGLKEYLRNRCFDEPIDAFLFIEELGKKILLIPSFLESSNEIKEYVIDYCYENNITFEHLIDTDLNREDMSYIDCLIFNAQNEYNSTSINHSMNIQENNGMDDINR